jgi:TetR/AcrR family transcriptional regulator of autoinduction and epiphytic fitness
LWHGHHRVQGNGFEVTSMDKIAATAGVSKRTVYNHFPSKEELFAEILHQLWASSVAQLDVSYASDRPLREQLRELLEAKMKMMSDANFLDLARVAIAATIHSPERAQDMVNRLSQREEGFTQWVRAAQEDGRLAQRPGVCRPPDPKPAQSFAFWPQITLGQPPLTHQPGQGDRVGDRPVSWPVTKSRPVSPAIKTGA